EPRPRDCRRKKDSRPLFAGHAARSRWRSAARRYRRRRARHHKDPGRGQAADDIARVSRRPSPHGRRGPDAAPMIAPARIAAYEILSGGGGGRAGLSDALAATRATLRDDRDKALAAEIAIGVQRWRAALDHLIAHFAKRPIRKLDPEVLEILRLSAYQLLHLTRVPAAAVVDDAVNLTGRLGKRSASGLVNAV